MNRKSAFARILGGLGMSSKGWNVLKIGNIGRIVTGKTPPTQYAENFGNKYPFITPRDMSGQKRINQTERYLSEKGKNEVKNCLLPVNAICVSCIGSDMGKVVMTTTNSITNQQLNSIICNDSFNPDFIYYALVNISSGLRNIGHNSTAVPILNKTDFSNFEISVPDIFTQRRIAEILSALDDKIELNRQTNATLEAIAQAIFKEWFVDFDFPGATGEMVESEMGMIPKGWRAGKVEDFVKISTGKGLHKNEFIERGYPVLGANGLIGYTGNYLLDEEVILTGRVGTLGTFQLVNERVWISDNVLILQPIDKEKYYFSYFWLKTINFRNLNRGSTQPLVTKTDLSNQQLLIPDPITLLMFDMICRSLYNHFNNNKQQSFTLTTIRDTLLPRLINGEIPV